MCFPRPYGPRRCHLTPVNLSSSPRLAAWPFSSCLVREAVFRKISIPHPRTQIRARPLAIHVFVFVRAQKGKHGKHNVFRPMFTFICWAGAYSCSRVGCARREGVRRESPSRRPATSRGSLLPSPRTQTVRLTRLRAVRLSPLERPCAD